MFHNKINLQCIYNIPIKKQILESKKTPITKKLHVTIPNWLKGRPLTLTVADFVQSGFLIEKAVTEGSAFVRLIKYLLLKAWQFAVHAASYFLLIPTRGQIDSCFIYKPCFRKKGMSFLDQMKPLILIFLDISSLQLVQRWLSTWLKYFFLASDDSNHLTAAPLFTLPERQQTCERTVRFPNNPTVQWTLYNPITQY